MEEQTTTMTPMRILIVSSCTGQKTVEDSLALTGEDFARGPEFVREREAALTDKPNPTQDPYRGLQPMRLMRGNQPVADGLSIDLFIVLARYGLVPRALKLAPYECTFTVRGKANRHAWASITNCGNA